MSWFSSFRISSLGEVEIVFTHIFQYWIFIISSLLFRYSIFKDLLFHPPTFEVFGCYLVEIKGIEPLTPCLQSRCSPSWAKPPHQVLSNPFSGPSKSNNIYLNFNLSPVPMTDHLRCSVIAWLLRKEVIQPQVLLRLPCYDFTPITSFTFGGVLLAVRLSTSGPPGSHGVTGGVYKARERIHRGMLIRDY